MPDGSRRTEEVSDLAYRLYRELKGPDAPLTPAFVHAQELTPSDHVVMQAAVQKYVDSSISKTIKCPEDIAFAAFKELYRPASDPGNTEAGREGKECGREVRTRWTTE